MLLESEQIEHLANLAKLKLSSDEKEKFSRQLNEILNYFKQLQELDTKNVAVTSQITDLFNATRLDEVKNYNTDVQTAILKNSPQQSGRYFKVNKIL